MSVIVSRMRVLRFIVVGIGLVAVCAGCESETSQAKDLAAAGNRRHAAEALEGLRGVFVKPRASGNVLADAKAEIAYLGQGTVIGGSSDQEKVVVDVSFVGGAEAGGGDWSKSFNARTCVRYTGTTGPGGRTEMADLACPADLPTFVPGVGKVDGTVPLKP